MFAPMATSDSCNVYACIKEWISHKDTILSELSKSVINRRLGKIEISNKPISRKKIEEIKKEVAKAYNISLAETDYFVYEHKVSNSAYQDHNRIMLLNKDGSVEDVAKASDQLNIKALSEKVTKYFVYYPKAFRLSSR